jgi:hypothetical protein
MYKYISAIALMLASSASFAESRIDLQGGSSTTIRPYETTTVTCNAPKANSHFCACGGDVNGTRVSDGTMVRLDMVSDKVISTYIADYYSSSSCRQALEQKTVPACQ